MTFVDCHAEVETLKKLKPGDKRTVAELYAVAAMWLRAGQTLPPSYAEWLADRLNDIGAAIEQVTDNSLGKNLGYATWATSPGKPGRKKEDEVMVSRKNLAVMTYEHLKDRGLSHEDCITQATSGTKLTKDNLLDALKKRNS